MERFLIFTSILLGFFFSSFSGTIKIPASAPTIEKGLESATHGDTLLISDGKYQVENLTLNKSVTILAENPQAVRFSVPFEKAGVIIDSCSPIIIGILFEQKDDSCSSVGILVRLTSACRIYNCSFTGLRTGISLKQATQCKIKGCSFTDCFYGIVFSEDTGVNSRASSNCSVDSNTITGCTYGIDLAHVSTMHFDNSFSRNTITECGTGISMITVARNTFSNNHFLANKGVAISIRDCMAGAPDNFFYENIFEDNNEENRQVVIDLVVSKSYWDKQQKGNYWSDYDGKDLNSDGIGDTPYILNDTTQDNYPLMTPGDITPIVTQELRRQRELSITCRQKGTSTVFRWQQESITSAEIHVFTMKGCAVLRSNPAEFMPGDASVTMDFSRLAAGAYICRLISGTQVHPVVYQHRQP